MTCEAQKYALPVFFNGLGDANVKGQSVSIIQVPHIRMENLYEGASEHVKMPFVYNKNLNVRAKL